MIHEAIRVLPVCIWLAAVRACEGLSNPRDATTARTTKDRTGRTHSRGGVHGDGPWPGGLRECAGTTDVLARAFCESDDRSSDECVTRCA